MAITYKINGKDLWTTFGVRVSGSIGVIDAPKLKDTVSGDWPEHHGLIVDLTKRVYQARQITLECFCVGTSAEDFVTKISSLIDEFQLTGKQVLTIEVITGKPLIYNVYLDGGIDIDKRWQEAGQMIGTFSLKLIEPEPVKKIISVLVRMGYPEESQNVVFTSSNPINIYWGDGNVTNDVLGTAVTTNHSYTADGTYYIVMTGRIEDITAFTTSGTVIWTLLP